MLMALIVLGRIASPPADVLPVEQTPRRQFACPTAGNVPVWCWLAHHCHAVGWGALVPDVFLMIIMASSQQTESKGSVSTETSWRKNKGNSKKSANETQSKKNLVCHLSTWKVWQCRHPAHVPHWGSGRGKIPTPDASMIRFDSFIQQFSMHW